MANMTDFNSTTSNSPPSMARWAIALIIIIVLAIIGLIAYTTMGPDNAATSVTPAGYVPVSSTSPQ
jgi:flagellar basal body-associated protein FliL